MTLRARLLPRRPATVLRVTITSYGILHQDPPTGDAVTLDLTRALRNPHHDPAMRNLTGQDQAVRDHVLSTPGAWEIVSRTVRRILALAAIEQPVNLHVYCKGGKHRSVAIAEAVAAELRALGVQVEVTHRHTDLPVVQPVPGKSRVIGGWPTLPDGPLPQAPVLDRLSADAAARAQGEDPTARSAADAAGWDDELPAPHHCPDRYRAVDVTDRFAVLATATGARFTFPGEAWDGLLPDLRMARLLADMLNTFECERAEGGGH